MTNWEWPQYYVAIVAAITVLLWTTVHGKPMTGKFNATVKLVGVSWLLFVLYMGGFWS